MTSARAANGAAASAAAKMKTLYRIPAPSPQAGADTASEAANGQEEAMKQLCAAGAFQPIADEVLNAKPFPPPAHIELDTLK